LRLKGFNLKEEMAVLALLRSWVQIIPPGPLLSTDKLWR